MTVEEFNQWFIYRQTKLLPHRRFEYYIAQLTLHVSALGMQWGGPKYNLQDFLFDSHLATNRKEDTADTGAEALSAIGGVKVIKLGQRRKRG